MACGRGGSGVLGLFRPPVLGVSLATEVRYVDQSTEPRAIWEIPAKKSSSEVDKTYFVMTRRLSWEIATRALWTLEETYEAHKYLCCVRLDAHPPQHLDYARV